MFIYSTQSKDNRQDIWIVYTVYALKIYKTTINKVSEYSITVYVHNSFFRHIVCIALFITASRNLGVSIFSKLLVKNKYSSIRWRSQSPDYLWTGKSPDCAGTTGLPGLELGTTGSRFFQIIVNCLIRHYSGGRTHIVTTHKLYILWSKKHMGRYNLGRWL